MVKKRILITGINGLVAAQIANSLNSTGNYNLIGTEANPFGRLVYSPTVVGKVHIGPAAGDIKYINFLNSVIKKENIDFIVVTNEVEVLYLSENIDKLEGKTCILDFPFVNICKSKWNTYLAIKDKYYAPKTYFPNTTEDIKRVFDRSGSPIWLRADCGQAAATAFKVKTVGEARNWLELKGGWGKYTASEFLPGRNLACVILYSPGGNYITTCIYERLMYLNPLSAQTNVTGVASVFRTVHDEDAVRISRDAVDTLSKVVGYKPKGLITVDLKGDKEENLKLTEVNPRPSNTFIFTKAGLNLADLFVKVALDFPVSVAKYKPHLYHLRTVDYLPSFVEHNNLL